MRLRAAGDHRNAAEALLNLGFSCMDMGLPDGAAKTLEAVALVEHDEPSLEKVVVLYNGSFAEGDAGRLERALELAQLAVQTAEELGLPAEAKRLEKKLQLLSGRTHGQRLGALSARRCRRPGRDARGQRRRSVSGVSSTTDGQLRGGTHRHRRPSRGAPVYSRGLEILHERGLGRLEVRMQSNVVQSKWDAGLWDEFLSEFHAIELRLEQQCACGRWRASRMQGAPPHESRRGGRCSVSGCVVA